MDPGIITYLEAVRFFNSETSAAMFSAELFWFFGGLFAAWVCCAFCLVIRGVRAGAGHVDL